MATIVTRAGKGAPLTHNEVDANFTNLNTDKLESGSTAASLTITSADINGGTIDGTVIGGASAAAGTFTTLEADDGNVGTFASDTGASSPKFTITSTGEQLLLQGATNGVGQSVDLLFEQKTTLGTQSRVAGKISSIAVSSYTAGSGPTFDSDLAFYTAQNGFNNEHFRITQAGNVGIGTTSPATNLEVLGATGNSEYLRVGNDISIRSLRFSSFAVGGTNDIGHLISAPGATVTGGVLAFATGNNTTVTERMRIDAAGSVFIGKTGRNFNVAGIDLNVVSDPHFVVDGTTVCSFNRLTDDGTLLHFAQGGTIEGSISVSGTTVSYNGGHLARWSQTADNTRIDGLLKGTVLTNLDQMAVWGDEENEQLNCMAVSSTEGDPNVAGVFVNWDNDDDEYTNDMNIAMTGDMIIRIGAGVTVQRGDLLMSAGDGTAKPQGDDIVRSKTIAKVTSTHVTCTYEDGSYCVPCVLMAC
jgi:hypothetical protein